MGRPKGRPFRLTVRENGASRLDCFPKIFRFKCASGAWLAPPLSIDFKMIVFSSVRVILAGNTGGRRMDRC
jgi:hypothetical protein